MSRAFLKPRYCAASTTICWRPAIIERGVNDFLDRCRYKGDHGMRRWVGLGVIGDNLVTMGNAMARRTNL